jgi:ferrochelatase
MSKKGVLLINLGTPDSPNIADVKSYLKTFLMDKRVIQLPYLLRFILVHAIIVPFRSKKSAHAYQKIWLEQGSPLKIHTQNLINKLKQHVDSSTTHITYAMRYGHPSIAMALESLKHCDEITILPLYPQYASATTGSSLAEVFQYFSSKNMIPHLKILRDFYHHPSFIAALADSIKPWLGEQDHLLLSYHGLPENQLEDIGCHPVCKTICQTRLTPGKACYKQQCHLGSMYLAHHLGLSEQDYTVSFQSRLGKTPWIKPYTDEVLKDLAKRGVKRLLIACPSFVADCLETLEEIGIQAKAQWQEYGGESCQLIPCLNDHDNWVEGLKAILSL